MTSILALALGLTLQVQQPIAVKFPPTAGKLSDFVAELAKVSGRQLSVGATYEDEFVFTQFESKTVDEIMAALAYHVGGKWSEKGTLLPDSKARAQALSRGQKRLRQSVQKILDRYKESYQKHGIPNAQELAKELLGEAPVTQVPSSLEIFTSSPSAMLSGILAKYITPEQILSSTNRQVIWSTAPGYGDFTLGAGVISEARKIAKYHEDLSAFQQNAPQRAYWYYEVMNNLQSTARYPIEHVIVIKTPSGGPDEYMLSLKFYGVDSKLRVAMEYSLGLASDDLAELERMFSAPKALEVDGYNPSQSETAFIQQLAFPWGGMSVKTNELSSELRDEVEKRFAAPIQYEPLSHVVDDLYVAGAKNFVKDSITTIPDFSLMLFAFSGMSAQAEMGSTPKAAAGIALSMLQTFSGYEDFNGVRLTYPKFAANRTSRKDLQRLLTDVEAVGYLRLRELAKYIATTKIEDFEWMMSIDTIYLSRRDQQLVGQLSGRTGRLWLQFLGGLSDSDWYRLIDRGQLNLSGLNAGQRNFLLDWIVNPFNSMDGDYQEMAAPAEVQDGPTRLGDLPVNNVMSPPTRTLDIKPKITSFPRDASLTLKIDRTENLYIVRKDGTSYSAQPEMLGMLRKNSTVESHADQPIDLNDIKGYRIGESRVWQFALLGVQGGTQDFTENIPPQSNAVLSIEQLPKSIKDRIKHGENYKFEDGASPDGDPVPPTVAGR